MSVSRFNSTPLAVLNISRQSMADVGFSPATRVFEATGAGACVITDAWPGIGDFFNPGKELLVARDGPEVARQLLALDASSAGNIGSHALDRARREHTYERRAKVVHDLLCRLGLQRALRQDEEVPA